MAEMVFKLHPFEEPVMIKMLETTAVSSGRYFRLAAPRPPPPIST